MTIKYSACALPAGQLRPQTHSEYVILTVLPQNNGYVNGSECYNISILPVFFFSCLEKCGVDGSQFVNECFALYESCETYMEGLQVSTYG